ncbi:MAG TPA: hypothetical protein VJZ91_05285, partial [Blastocatellia bacterium]|nr:hypothetical protein [Blastocatellia bacterium]
AMEMQKSYYVVTYRPAYLALLQSRAAAPEAGQTDDAAGLPCVVISITQGGFGQDIVDDERQAKERFLEYLFYADDVDLSRTADVFDDYFTLTQADELIDLDEEF